ncbi:MAG: NDP-sugar synthase [Pyrinomonadaceae bacterium]|nr:NDP-sugar synthase [Pyrinomonadaceae bacterium]
MLEYPLMRAMILSAGYGTRLWPLTEDRTKPAMPILGKPLVGYVAEYLASFGCDDIVVNLHHRPESVRAALGDGSRYGVKLHYVDEPVILGTSGALDNAREILEGETIVVVNGKIITDIDLNAAFETHRRTEAIATLVLLPNPDCQRFTVVETSDGLLKGFGSMPVQSEYVGREAPMMFTGIQILEPGIFKYIPRGVFSHSTSDVYPQAMAKGERIAVHVATGIWYELSTPQRYLDISLAMLAERGEHLSVGSACVISERADVSQSVLWDGVVIEADVRIRRAVLGDGVRITAGEVIENAVVVRNSLVEGKTSPLKALKGVVRGDNFVVSLSQ